MADLKISSMVAGDQTNSMSDYSTDTATLDESGGQKEITYTNSDWGKQLGYFKDHTIIQEIINARARWTIGKGYQADEITVMLLDTIKGVGHDTFNTILENMIRVYHIGGDSYSEIIRDNEGNLINLKPLDPLSMGIVSNRQSVVIRYDYKQADGKTHKFKPEEIFHLSRNRIGHESHGWGMVDVLMADVDTLKEAISDYKKVIHRFVMPQWKFKLKTDDATEIAAYKTKMDKATSRGDNIYEPFDTCESELLTVAPNATLDPKAWIEQREAAIYRAAGVPQFVVGGGTGFTEASEKISYLAWQQTIEEDQLYIEEQILSQLNLLIELEFPASLENELLSDQKKDGAQNIDQSEMNPGSENQ